MPDDLPDLTPSETERVRRLLAEARHTEPLPDAVVDRLDRTLADLRRERPPAPVPLAPRRSRRAAPWLAAAAAVVAVGVGVGQLVPGTTTSGDDASSSSAGSSAADRDAAGGAAEPVAPESAADLPPVEDATFTADVLAARALPTASGEGGAGTLYDTGCERPGWGRGRRVVVRYAGAPAALVYRAPSGADQRVDLFACDSDTPLRSVTVRAP